MTTNNLASLAKTLQPLEASSHPSVHLWNPKHCGDIDIVVQHNGTWLHDGSEIKRPALVNLFASVLWLEAEEYYLKTPAEKLSITVETTPFLVTQMDIIAAGTRDQIIQFTTSYGDMITLGDAHPLSLDSTLLTDQEVPVIEIRYGMKGRLTRSVFEALVDAGEHVTLGDTEALRWSSDGKQIELPFT